MKKVHLKDVPQERRRYILERFFQNWDKPYQPTETKKGHTRVEKDLIITGTDDPTYKVEHIDERHIHLTLEI